MSGFTEMIIAGEPTEVFEPDAGMLTHLTDFDSFADRLTEAETDYNDTRAAFFRTDPNTEDIMKAAEIAEAAAKALISRALTAFHMYNAGREDKMSALKILDRMTKESSIREQTCCRYYHDMRKKPDTGKKWLWGLFREKLKRMKFLDRCVRTQSSYNKRMSEDKNSGSSGNELAEKLATKAERTRACIPEGGRFCPPRIFPHDPIPEGEPVPIAPDPYRRFKKMEAKDLVFNMEHFNFELPPDYVSEDGLIDSESVVWDYENSKVTMKYRGGVPVTWDFKQYIDPRDVPKPDEWILQYHLRLFEQEKNVDPYELFRHHPRDEEIPDYNRIPKK